MRAQGAYTCTTSSAVRRSQSGRLKRPWISGRMYCCESRRRAASLGRSAPVAVWALCASLDFRHCVPMRAQDPRAFTSSGAVRQLETGRLTHRWIELRATVNSGAVRLREFGRCAPVATRAPRAPQNPGSICQCELRVVSASTTSGAVRALKSGRLARPWWTTLGGPLLRTQALRALAGSGAARRFQSGRLARPWISGTVCHCELRRRVPLRVQRLAPVEIRALCAFLGFRRCVAVRGQAPCAFPSSGAVRPLESGRLLRP